MAFGGGGSGCSTAPPALGQPRTGAWPPWRGGLGRDRGFEGSKSIHTTYRKQQQRGSTKKHLRTHNTQAPGRLMRPTSTDTQRTHTDTKWAHSLTTRAHTRPPVTPWIPPDGTVPVHTTQLLTLGATIPASSLKISTTPHRQATTAHTQHSGRASRHTGRREGAHTFRPRHP